MEAISKLSTEQWGKQDNNTHTSNLLPTHNPFLFFCAQITGKKLPESATKRTNRYHHLLVHLQF